MSAMHDVMSQLWILRRHAGLDMQGYLDDLDAFQALAYRMQRPGAENRRTLQQLQDALLAVQTQLTAEGVGHVAPVNHTLTRAARDVLAERQRQAEEEGYTLAHDDMHRAGQLATAGACYALAGAGKWNNAGAGYLPMDWPWKMGDWNPKGPRQDLVRAAALILAEIERLDRRALQPRSVA